MSNIENIDLPDRISHVIRDLGGLNKAADITGISRSVLSKYQRGETEPTYGKLRQISERGGVDITWLITGVDNQVPDIVQVPVYDIELAAGDGSIAERGEIIQRAPFRAAYLTAISGRTDFDSLAMFQARGDSMYPTIADRDFVMIDLHDTVQRDGIFAIALGNQARIKRLHYGIGGINVLSDNQEFYQPETITGRQSDSLDIIGRAIWRMGKL